jgi:hypothetical protein
MDVGTVGMPPREGLLLSTIVISARNEVGVRNVEASVEERLYRTHSDFQELLKLG